MNHRSYDALWFGITTLGILLLAFLLPLVSNDYWWYVRLGEIILQTGRIPAVDTFSWTQAGQPVFYHSWMSAVVFARLQPFGLDALFLLRGLALWITYAILWIICRKSVGGPRLATLLTLLAALAGSGNWSHRPQLLVYPLFALALWLLWQPEQLPSRWFWFPLLGLLWVNLHGSYVLLWALLGAAWLGFPAHRRPLTWALLLTVAASLLNPHGWEAWAYVWRMLRDPSSQQFSVEWLPPRNEGWQMAIFFAWLLALPWLVTQAERRWNAAQWLWFFGFGWLALRGVRYVIWETFLLVPLTGLLLSRWREVFDRPPQRINPQINWPLAVLLPLVALAFLPGVRSAFLPPDLLPAEYDVPRSAAAALAAHPEWPGPLWADLDFSSYLVWAVSQRPVWIDTRFEVYPAEQWQRYQAIAAARWDWAQLLDAEGVSLLFLSRERQAALLQAVAADGGWQKVYEDSQAVIYVRP